MGLDLQVAIPDRAAALLEFWLDEVGPAGWYAGGADLDARIRDEYGALWETARHGGLAEWQTTPHGALAYIILADQFPRNMFRDDARA